MTQGLRDSPSNGRKESACMKASSKLCNSIPFVNIHLIEFAVCSVGAILNYRRVRVSYVTSWTE